MCWMLLLRKSLRALVVFVCTCVLSGRATLWALDPTRAATQYKYDDFAAVEGLPYPSIRAIAQSADGYLWFGTRAGCGRFDGVRMVDYTAANTPALPSNLIQDFYLAPDGTFWVTTDRGVLWIRKGQWTRPPELAALETLNIRGICGDGKGGVYLATRTQLYHFQNGRCETVALNGVTLETVNRLVILRSGDLLMCARPTVLVSQGNARVVSVKDGLSNDETTAAVEDTAGGLWIGTPRGLHYWRGAEKKSFTVQDGLPVNAVRSLLIDRDQNVWVGTPNGLTRYANERFEQVIVNGIERLSHVLALCEDREGNLWGGTDNGFFRLTDAAFVNLSQREGLQSNSVLAVHQARDGSAWIGTWGGGLSHVTAENLRTYRTSDGLIDDGVMSLAEDKDGQLWIGYYARGVSRFDGSHFVNYRETEGVSERVLQIVTGPAGEVWILPWQVGLTRLVGSRFEKVPGAPLADQRAMLVNSDGSVLVAGDLGVARFSDGKWELFKRAKPKGSLAQSIVKDDRGVVWVMRDNGELDRFHDGRTDTVSFGEKVGPLSYGAVFSNGALWLSFRFGAVRVMVSELEAVIAGKKSRPSFEMFDESDGMRSRAPNVLGSPGVSAMADGSVWFATSKGVAIIDRNRIRREPEAPTVVLESIRADKVEQDSSGLTQIPPGRGELEFRFTALHLTMPNRVAFRYRLKGVDEDWIYAGSKREAHYGGLPPGTRRFEVAASFKDGEWNPQVTSVEFTILPFFYQRWWFRGATALSLILMAVGLYGWRMRRVERKAQSLQRQNEDLERGIAERTAALAKSNEALRASEYFYHSLVESMPQIILRKDPTGRITYANSAFAELIRRPLSDVIGQIDYDLCPAELGEKLRADDQRVLSTGQVLEHEHVVDRPGEPRRYLHCKRVPLYNRERKPIGIQVLFWDMTRFRETEDKLKEAQRELVETSRLAGIAEMATGVLHNIGNALNSVNTSASVVADAIRGMKLGGVTRLSELLREERDKGVEFLATHPRGKQLPDYVSKLGEHLESERELALRELVQLEQSVEHIKEIVVAQQSHAQVSGIVEIISPAELLEHAYRICELSFRRRNVAVARSFQPTPMVKVERQKALQILVNLFRNASDALDEANRPDKRLSLGLAVSNEGRVQISVSDNGVGISPENLTRIFGFGFTTKKTGHGFGLHSSALAARELEGSLTVASAGLGKGATFTLELPPALKEGAAALEKAVPDAVVVTKS